MAERMKKEEASNNPLPPSPLPSPPSLPVPHQNERRRETSSASNTDHLDNDPLLLSITRKHRDVQEETHKLQRDLDKVQQLILTLMDQQHALERAIRASKEEEEDLLDKYDDERRNVEAKWRQLSAINHVECFWNVLPSDVLAHIFMFLGFKEVLSRVCLVNRQWRDVVFTNNHLWHSWIVANRWIWGSSRCVLVSADLPTPAKIWLHAPHHASSKLLEPSHPSSSPHTIINETGNIFLSSSSVSSSSSSSSDCKFPASVFPSLNASLPPHQRKPYKQCFIEAAKSERKWKKGEAVYGMFKSGHPSLSCISLDQRYLITARRSFKVWDIHFSEAPRCMKVLDPHLAHNTKCMQLNNDTLIAGGKYGLKVLNVESGNSSLVCEDECYALHFDNHTLVHGSFNQIIVRDMHTLKPTHTFVGHANMVKGICRNNDVVVTASWLQTKIWDLRTKVCQKVMHSGVKRNCCVADENIVVSSNGRVVHIWDLRVHKESLLLNRSVSALSLEGAKLVVARRDRCIDILNAKLDPTPFVVLGPIMNDEIIENATRITSIKTYYRKMIAGTSKGTVHVWEF